MNPSHLPRICAIRLPAVPFLAGLFAVALPAQETLEQRMDRLERENRDLRVRLDSLERQDELPPGAQKAPAVAEGVSLAGYGEYVFTQRSGRTDEADALRTVLYLGYRFDQRWLFHSEIELEHGSTSASSGTTTSGGEVSLEFGYLEYEVSPALSLRGGMVLVPVGLVNEQHEPTLFLPNARPQTETRIIPTTWRELGVEAALRFGDFDLRWFGGTSLDGERFDATGLRGGRQKGNRAAADDLGTAVRLDWHGIDGLSLGGSAWYGRAGQDQLRGTTPIPELDTGILAAHADWRHGPWQARVLWATALSDDAGDFARATGRNLARRQQGGYVEVGADVLTWILPDSSAALIPFVRHERIDTQAEVAGGMTGDPRQDDEILTFGLHWRPLDRLVIKADFESWDHDHDRWSIGFGYVF